MNKIACKNSFFQNHEYLNKQIAIKIRIKPFTTLYIDIIIDTRMVYIIGRIAKMIDLTVVFNKNFLTLLICIYNLSVFILIIKSIL